MKNSNRLDNLIDKKPDNPASFEEAIAATGFGKFNWVLMTVVAIPSAWASLMTTCSTSFILPLAQCDLELSLKDKGMLNAIVFMGMMSGGLIWAFLSDTLGRKIILVVGFLVDGFFVILSGVTQSYSMVLFSRFMDGFVISGPHSVLTTTVSEFHSSKFRARIILILALLSCSTNLLLPFLSWAILPANIDVSLFNGTIVLHSWNVFVILTALPSIIAGIFHIFLPESPKYLMTMGENGKALDVFRKVYSWNTGKDPSTYPVHVLVDEIQEKAMDDGKYEDASIHRSKMQALKNGWKQMVPLFLPPHASRILLVCTMEFGILMGCNTIRLWLPQIFTAINDYQVEDDESESLCKILKLAQKVNETTECSVNTDNNAVYYNFLVVNVVTMAGFLIASSVINKLGKKNIIFFSGIISGILATCLQLSTNTGYILAVSSIFMAFGNVCTNVLIAVVVDLFPTTLRTTTVTCTLTFGRLGSMVGNLVFPQLLELSCLVPFGTLGIIFATSSLFSVILPNTDLKSLE